MEDIYKGIYAAVTTPLTESFKPDFYKLQRHCEWLLDNGCTGLAPLGTTSEANSLTFQDRKDIIKYLGESPLPLERFIIGTSSTSLNEALDISSYALEAGFNKLLMLPPYYYKKPTEEGLYSFFNHLVKKISINEPKIFLYNFPQMTTIPFSLELVERLRKKHPGIFVGMKDSSGDFANTLSFINAFKDFAAFSGSEEFINKNLSNGGYGCISASTNLTAPIVDKSLREESSHEKDIFLQKAIAVRKIVSKKQIISGIKGCLSILKGDKAWRRTLPPIEEM